MDIIVELGGSEQNRMTFEPTGIFKSEIVSPPHAKESVHTTQTWTLCRIPGTFNGWQGPFFIWNIYEPVGYMNGQAISYVFSKLFHVYVPEAYSPARIVASYPAVIAAPCHLSGTPGFIVDIGPRDKEITEEHGFDRFWSAFTAFNSEQQA